MVKFILTVLICLQGYLCFGQNTVGAYEGKLLADKNLLLIKEIDGKQYLELFSSEKEYFSVDIVNVGNTFQFQLPLNDGSELLISYKDMGSYLLMAFEMDGEKYETKFDKIILPKKNPLTSFFENGKNICDPVVIGKWKHIKTYNPDGSNNTTDGSAGRGYINTYYGDGRMVPDAQMFRDAEKQNGNSNFSYLDIPAVNWKTTGQYLIIEVNGAPAEYEYFVKNDTLTLITPTKIKQIHVKVK